VAARGGPRRARRGTVGRVAAARASHRRSTRDPKTRRLRARLTVARRESAGGFCQVVPTVHTCLSVTSQPEPSVPASPAGPGHGTVTPPTPRRRGPGPTPTATSTSPNSNTRTPRSVPNSTVEPTGNGSAERSANTASPTTGERHSGTTSKSPTTPSGSASPASSACGDLSPGRSIFVVNRTPKKTFVASAPPVRWRHPPREFLFLRRLPLYRRRTLRRLLLYRRLTRSRHPHRVPIGTPRSCDRRPSRSGEGPLRSRPTCRSA
jgi:hypothetical protein